MIETTETHMGKQSKVDRYGWTVEDRPGVLLDIDKMELRVDNTYQRPAHQDKVVAIARGWSWMACGVITVADRSNVFYVIDGQHRVLAARRRADISTLPCIVFTSQEKVAEADAFLRVNTHRKNMSGIEKFRPQLITKNPAAMMVQRLCDEVGREIKESPGPNSVRCVSTMMRLASNDPAILERVWPLLHQLLPGRPISERLLSALVYIEKNMPDGTSLLDKFWRERVMRVGASAMEDGAMRSVAYHKKGGPRICALGVVQALNFNARIRLKLVRDLGATEGDQE